jgi:lipopolysaccharide biosynthesis glycosyltransferase
MGVAMTSILLNSSERDEYFFHVISNFISDRSRRKLHDLTEIHGAELDICSIGEDIRKDIEKVNTIGDDTHFTEASYYRLMVGRIFPDLEKILYLDCDLVVLESLEELWNRDLSNSTIAAVEEIMTPPLHGDTFMGIQRYFNSGVLLFNLSRWRKLGYEQKCLGPGKDLLKRTAHHDQSILNHVFRNGDVEYLGARYNYLINFKNFFPRSRDPVTKGLDPVIVHYAGLKPWDIDGFLDRDSSLDDFSYYLDYFRLSPWADEELLGNVKGKDLIRYLCRHPKDTFTAARRLKMLKKGCHSSDQRC